MSQEGITKTDCILLMLKQLLVCEESDENYVIQWINVDKAIRTNQTVILGPTFKQKLTQKKMIMEIMSWNQFHIQMELWHSRWHYNI